LSNDRIKIGVLVSGGGTNLQAIIDATEKGEINGEVVLVISSKKDAYSLERARKHGIEGIYIGRKNFPDNEAFSKAMADELEKRGIMLVCMAGFLKKLSPDFIKRFKERIMNIHPALLPLFGGEGLYGHYVHETVLNYGVKVSGCTVHFVDEEYDRGPIILQRAVPVMEGDTPESLAARILKEEHKIYPQAIRLFSEGKLKIEERRVKILQKSY